MQLYTFYNKKVEAPRNCTIAIKIVGCKEHAQKIKQLKFQNN